METYFFILSAIWFPLGIISHKSSVWLGRRGYETKTHQWFWPSMVASLAYLIWYLLFR